MRRRSVFTATLSLLSVAACSDSVAPARTAHTALSPASDADLDRSGGRGVFNRYVAIGTSVSMGWQSDGVVAATQETSWPEQLAELAHRSISQPYIDGTGCRSPLIAPLASGRRLSGEGAGQDPATLSCSPLRADVMEPVQNLAINAATTADALFTTPENTTDASNRQLIGRVLQPGMTQVSSMIAQNPKLVSVELGGNEVLNARSGIVIPGVTVAPFATWAPLYDQVLDQVESVAKEAVIVGLIDDVASFPAFRRGDEMWQTRAFFGALHVSVADDCAGSPNLLFVPVVVPTAVATAAAAGSYTLHCAGGGPTTQDFTLTPAEAGAVNALLAQMNAHIRGEAERRGFAYFALQELYGRSDIKGPFNPIALMTSLEPYGPFVSLDGVHPTAAGARILAEAAARALDARYDHHILAQAAPLIAANQ
jgi:lysophospholipase L1-like esterase